MSICRPPAAVRSHRVCVEVWGGSAVAAWSAVQSAEWSASILKGLFLSVSDPLLPDCHQQRQSAAGPAPVWTITKPLCRRHKSLFVRETNWEGWGGWCGERVCWATLPAVLLFAVVSSGFVCVLLQLVGESWGHNVRLSPKSQHVISGQTLLICVRPLPTLRVCQKFAALQPFSDAAKLNSPNQTRK